MTNELRFDQVAADWEKLIKEAKTKYIFGEPFDEKLFQKCMKEAYEYVRKSEYLERINKIAVFQDIIVLYSLIFTYSYLPSPNELKGEEVTLFDASLPAAVDLAHTILFSKYTKFKNGKMIGNWEKYNLTTTYDFETGDLSDYIEIFKKRYNK